MVVVVEEDEVVVVVVLVVVVVMVVHTYTYTLVKVRLVKKVFRSDKSSSSCFGFVVIGCTIHDLEEVCEYI